MRESIGTGSLSSPPLARSFPFSLMCPLLLLFPGFFRAGPGAWAHAPLEKRLHELNVPVTFIYGKEDWMRPEEAVKVRKREEEREVREGRVMLRRRPVRHGWEGKAFEIGCHWALHLPSLPPSIYTPPCPLTHTRPLPQLCKRLESERPRKVATDLKVEIINRAGHFVFFEQPELFNR